MTARDLIDAGIAKDLGVTVEVLRANRRRHSSFALPRAIEPEDDDITDGADCSRCNGTGLGWNDDTCCLTCHGTGLHYPTNHYCDEEIEP